MTKAASLVPRLVQLKIVIELPGLELLLAAPIALKGGKEHFCSTKQVKQRKLLAGGIFDIKGGYSQQGTAAVLLLGSKERRSLQRLSTSTCDSESTDAKRFLQDINHKKPGSICGRRLLFPRQNFRHSESATIIDEITQISEGSRSPNFPAPDCESVVYLHCCEVC
jgi:hypothetical protein